MVNSNEVINGLRSRFCDVENHLEDVPDTGRVTGVIISAEFDELDHKERQDLLWQTLEKLFTAADLKNIGPIVTMTPVDAELGAMSTD